MAQLKLITVWRDGVQVQEPWSWLSCIIAET